MAPARTALVFDTCIVRPCWSSYILFKSSKGDTGFPKMRLLVRRKVCIELKSQATLFLEWDFVEIQLNWFPS